MKSGRNLEGKNVQNAVLKSQLSGSLSSLAGHDRQLAGSFVDELNAQLPSAHVDPRDMNVYETVELNGLIWMAENLRFESNAGSWQAVDTANESALGRLYSWEAAMRSCPPGWRLPSEEEWMQMSQLFGGEAAYDDLVQGGHSNFSAHLAGSRNPSGNFNESGKLGFYWTRSESDEDKAWLYTFIEEFQVLRPSSLRKTWGLSCRCVKE